MEKTLMAKEIVQSDLPAIRALLQRVLHREDYSGLTRMGGLTNRTYKVAFPDGACYVVRIPGEGTEELIVRRDEEISTRLACKLDIDAELLYFGADGAKVTRCIPDAETMNAASMREEKHLTLAAQIFRRLHDCGEDTGVPFEVFVMAKGYEKIITENHVPMFDDYAQVKARVMEIKSEIDRLCGCRLVPCHNDPLCENWVMSGGKRMYLIDWEYAGMNDAFWDIADVSIEAEYDAALDERFLCEYLGGTPTDTDRKHFLAAKLYVDYLWTLWAKTRVPFDGQPMEDWAAERYARLKRNILEFEKI